MSFHFNFTHAWFLLFNFGAIALTVCMLTACRTGADSKYRQLMANGEELARTMGQNCTTCNFDSVPDEYMFGLSGLCRSVDGVITCERQFPYSFNISAAVFEDISNSSDSNSTAQYERFDSGHAVSEVEAKTFAKALAALLVTSVVLSFLYIVPSLLFDYAWSRWFLPFLAVDAIILVSALGIWFALINRTINGAFLFSSNKEWDSNPARFVGIGSWFLFGALGARLLSSPVLFVIALGLCLLVILFPLFLILCCFAGASETTATTVEVVTVFVY